MPQPGGKELRAHEAFSAYKLVSRDKSQTQYFRACFCFEYRFSYVRKILTNRCGILRYYDHFAIDNDIGNVKVFCFLQLKNKVLKRADIIKYNK